MLDVPALGRQDLGSHGDKTRGFCPTGTADVQVSPGGEMTGGRLDFLGFQLLFWRRFISLSGLVTESLTITVPGLR